MFFLRHGVKQVKFIDRTFNVLPAHYQPIWDFLAEQEEMTNFHFEIVADRLSSDEVRWLAKVPQGRFQFEIGVQSTCAETLQAIGRHNEWEKLHWNVQQMHRAGNIHLHLDLIAGLPYEGWNEFRQSFNSVYGLAPDMLQIGFLKMLPGTKIRAEADEHGYVFLKQPPYEVLSSRALSYCEIRRLKQIEEVFNQTYNSGRFANTLHYMVKVFGESAFDFYEALSNWWEGQGLLGSAHSPDAVLSSLLTFANDFSALQRIWVGELLKFDVICSGSQALIGEGLDWNREFGEKGKNEFWRSETAVARYIPDYRFSNWREVKRKYPIEVFAVDIPGWLDSGEEQQGRKVPLLFDLTRSKPQWHSIESDFFMGAGV